MAQNNWLRTNDVPIPAEWDDKDIERILAETDEPVNWRVWDSMLIPDVRD